MHKDSAHFCVGGVIVFSSDCMVIYLSSLGDVDITTSDSTILYKTWLAIFVCEYFSWQVLYTALLYIDERDISLFQVYAPACTIINPEILHLCISY